MPLGRSSVAPLPLDGAVVLITGAAGGIGRATARALHDRGARVVLVDLDAAAVADAARGMSADRVLTRAADVTDRANLDSAVADALDRWGRVDVAFANAGISSGDTADTIASVADGTFERVVAVNLTGVWNTVRAALPSIIEARGHVLVTSSTYAYLNGMVNAPYAATKAAVEQIGRALRVELRRHDASAGVLYPGWVRTPIADVAFGKDALATDLVARAFPSPFRRPIDPDRVGRAVAAGIERRSARIQVPRRWIPVSTMRGIVNPISDAALASDARLAALVGQVEARSGRMGPPRV
ncbi:SDR family NAD(P)-dependent oxidoreductase [Williamsia deligens]|uniref:SDR family NAD(P)-dependent oxidoreductase n=1 Tax=Williamsia deligens TaxID=321325 RepID=A0ABW3GGY6_9NOCA|nr:SDR family NAD(P)-dependent oxidoreductase [Williamsia deligens]MCP2195425.1 NADP-dependent 3-hydroxy acid dehydrogenase YdfG [Williamsia deligens]